MTPQLTEIIDTPMQYWLMKSEPDVFSIDHLKRDKTTWWEGVRNYQARNYMTNDMKVGDTVLFYHSNAEPSGLVGWAKVSQPAKPDPLQFDPQSEYFEKRATEEKPVWFCVQVQYDSHFPKMISLSELKSEKKLAKMLVIQRGQRLSIQPVTKSEFEHIRKMSQTTA